MASPERERLRQDGRREQNWQRWGPYLSERQWGTVREDYSADGNCWSYLPHDYARSRAYRWGEDGLLGITDRQCRLCFSFALWNERYRSVPERRGRADIVLGDTATSDAPIPLVEQADVDFFLSPGGDAVVFTASGDPREGLYVLPLH